jgi:hypothetical protein
MMEWHRKPFEWHAMPINVSPPHIEADFIALIAPVGSNRALSEDNRLTRSRVSKGTPADQVNTVIAANVSLHVALASCLSKFLCQICDCCGEL